MTFAARMSHRAAGNNYVSDMIKKITLTPTRASKYRKVNTTTYQHEIIEHTPSEALSIFVEANLSKRQWEIIYAANNKIYLCYSVLKNAKNDCYPKEESMTITETYAEVNLQDLLNHTSMRFCKYLDEVKKIKNLTEEKKHNLVLLSKWGCDGSQQSQFKQKFQSDEQSHANIFQSSLVPLRLICNIDGEKKLYGKTQFYRQQDIVNRYAFVFYMKQRIL